MHLRLIIFVFPLIHYSVTTGMDQIAPSDFFTNKIPQEIHLKILGYTAYTENPLGWLLELQKVSKYFAQLFSQQKIQDMLNLSTPKTVSEFFFNELKNVRAANLPILISWKAQWDKDLIISYVIQESLTQTNTNSYQELLKIIAILEEAGASWQNINEWEYLFCLTIRYRAMPYIELLLGHGKEPSPSDLNLAISQQDINTIKLLIQHGVNIENVHLALATQYGNNEIIQYLKDHIST